MVRRLAAGLGALAIVLATTLTSWANLARADGPTEVTITCGDGAAMTGVVTLSTLLELTQEVQDMTRCALSQDPSHAVTSTDQTGWTLYDQNPSHQPTAPRNPQSKMPPTTRANVR